MYEKAQDVREQTAKKSKARAEKIPYTENILRGRIFCGYCGKNLHRMRHYQGYYLYHCISNDRIGKGACEGRIYLKETDLFNIILTIIRQKTGNVIGKSLLLKRKDDKIAAQKTEVNREISKLRQETGKNRLVLSSLYENFVNGILTQTEYLEMKEGYGREIEKALERVQQLQERQESLENQMEQYISLADRLAALDEDAALTALLVDQLIERVTVNSSDDISIKFRFESGFERLMEVLADE